MVAPLLGEFLARWQVEGSFLEAVDSVFGLRTAEVPGDRAGAVPDDELGFKLGPAVEGLDSRGVRHAEFTVPKPEGLVRVLLLGDSVGFPIDGFFSEVERRIRNQDSRTFDFVNACVHGYTTWQERRFFERDLIDLESDLVLLQYCVNDNYRMLHRLTSGGRRLLTPEAKEHLFPVGATIGAWLSRHSYLVYCVRKLVYGMATESQRIWDHVGRSAWDPASWSDAEENLRAVRDAVVARGGRFAVVAVPHEDQLDPEGDPRGLAFLETPQRELRTRCAKLSIPMFDLLPMLRSRAGEGLYVDRLHLSDLGHRIVGEAVGEWLLVQGLLPGR